MIEIILCLRVSADGFVTGTQNLESLASATRAFGGLAMRIGSAIGPGMSWMWFRRSISRLTFPQPVVW